MDFVLRFRFFVAATLLSMMGVLTLCLLDSDPDSPVMFTMESASDEPGGVWADVVMVESGNGVVDAGRLGSSMV